MVSRSFRRLRLAVAVLATLISAAHAEVHFGGIAAGDISSTDAILWTRAENEGSAADLTAQVATDPGFSNIVGTSAAAPARIVISR